MMASYSDIIAKKKKEWNAPDLMDKARAERGKKIPFSSPLLNYSTYGGIPRNAITEFFGDPGGGKSTTSVDICKNAVKLFTAEFEAEVQALRDEVAKGNKARAVELDDLLDRGPKRVLYVDLEHSFDGAWASKLGISPGEIDIMQPPDVVAESLLQTVHEIIETGEVGLVVLDSIPSLTTQHELDKKYGERTVASLAGLLTIFCRKVIPLLTRYDCTLLCINQTRDNMDNPYVVNTPGGRALKFYCSLRVQFKIGAPVDFLGNELPSSAENPSGYIITAKIVKQKSAPWDRRNGTYYLMAQTGIRTDMDIAKLAEKSYNIIIKSGAWYTLTNPDTGEVIEADGKPVKLNGMSKVLDYMQQNPAYYQQVCDFILRDIAGEDAQKEESNAEPDEEGSEPVTGEADSE